MNETPKQETSGDQEAQLAYAAGEITLKELWQRERQPAEKLDDEEPF